MALDHLLEALSRHGSRLYQSVLAADTWPAARGRLQSWATEFIATRGPAQRPAVCAPCGRWASEAHGEYTRWTLNPCRTGKWSRAGQMRSDADSPILKKG